MERFKRISELEKKKQEEEEFHKQISELVDEAESLNLNYEQDKKKAINEKRFLELESPFNKIIEIYETSDKEVLRGTLEIKALGKTKGDHGPATNFVGHGTGEFKGVNIVGNSEPATITPPPPELIVQLNRVGTVMGWPT